VSEKIRGGLSRHKSPHRLPTDEEVSMAAKKRAAAKSKPAAKKPTAKRAAAKPARAKQAPANKSAKKRAARRGSGQHRMKQVSPFRPDPTKYARYQVIQDGLEVGWVMVKGYGTTQCLEVWQLYKTNAAGHGPGEYGFQRGFYVYPSYQNNQTENTDVTTRYVFRSVTPSIVVPPGLVNGTNYQTINATCTG
jgi:hypothetical protein